MKDRGERKIRRAVPPCPANGGRYGPRRDFRRVVRRPIRGRMIFAPAKGSEWVHRTPLMNLHK